MTSKMPDYAEIESCIAGQISSVGKNCKRMFKIGYNITVLTFQMFKNVQLFSILKQMLRSHLMREFYNKMVYRRKVPSIFYEQRKVC